MWLLQHSISSRVRNLRVPSTQRSTVRSVITRRDQVHPYPAKIQSRFSRKQRLGWKIFVLYFRLIFSCRITPFSLVPPVIEHPVYVSPHGLKYEDICYTCISKTVIASFSTALNGRKGYQRDKIKKTQLEGSSLVVREKNNTTER